MKTAIVHARIEPEIKYRAEEVLRMLGLTPTEAIRIFYKQISLRRGLPFPIEMPNEIRDEFTASVLESGLRGEDTREYDSLEGAFETWER